MDSPPSPLLSAALAFGLVLLVLSLLAGLIAVLARLGRVRPVPDDGVAAEGDGEEEGALSGELVAVLAAAAEGALGAQVRLHRVRRHRDPGAEQWSRAGRMDIMVSHKLESRR